MRGLLAQQPTPADTRRRGRFEIARRMRAHGIAGRRWRGDLRARASADSPSETEVARANEMHACATVPRAEADRMTKWMLLVASLALAACNRGQSASAQQLFRDASVLNVLGDAGRVMGGIVDGGAFRLAPPAQLPSQINPLQPPTSNPYAPPSVPTNPYAPGGTPPTVPR
jgi:hypothetical protein